MTQQIKNSHEAVAVDNAVRAFDDVSFARFFTVLVVGELVVFHVEAELVRWVGLCGWESIKSLPFSRAKKAIFARLAALIA
jgi:hypothetical protein